MTPKELRMAIEGWTAERGQFEARAYIGMSQVGNCPVTMYRNLCDGNGQGKGGEIRAYEGELHVEDMLARLVDLNVVEWLNDREITAFDGRVRGHPRVELVTVEGEPKTLVMVHSVDRGKFEDVMAEGRALRKHFESALMYMKYGGWGRTLVIYKCRDDGDVWVVEVMPNKMALTRVEEKVEAVLAALAAGLEPVCTCGRH